MLRFSPWFDLQKDVFPKIPPERLRANNHPSLTPSTIKLAVVGREPTGQILVSYNAYSGDKKTTFIDVYDPTNRVLASIYKHPTKMLCTNASFSFSQGALAFTQIVKPQNNPRGYSFRTFVTEVKEKNKIFEISTPAHADFPQQVIFVYPENVQGTKGNNKTEYLLYVVDKQLVQFYQIPLRVKSFLLHQTQIEIASAPNFLQTVGKQFLWHSWDPQCNSLFLLTAPTNSKPNSNEKCLHCYQLTEKGFRITWVMSVDLHLPNPTCPFVIEHLITKFDHRVPFNSNEIELQLFRLSSKTSYCLCCQYRAEVDNEPVIRVQVFMLIDKEKVDITIPAYNLPDRTKVFFGILGGMIMIYIPGIYLQLLDSCASHPLYMGLSINGEFANLIPSTVPVPNETLYAQYPHLRAGSSSLEKRESYSLSWFFSRDGPTKLSGAILLDRDEGVAYEYQINRDAFVELFSKHTSQSNLVCAIHLLFVHLQDNALIDRIMKFYCKNCSSATTLVFKEFLLAAPYLKAKQTENIHPILLAMMPLSSQQPCDRTLVVDRAFDFSSMPCAPVFSEPERVIIVEREKYYLVPRFQYDQIGDEPIDLSYFSVLTSSRIASYFKGYLKRSNLPAVPETSFRENPEVEDIGSVLTKATPKLVQGFSKYISKIFSHTINTKQALEISYCYRGLIVDQTNRLFSYILDSMEKDDSTQSKAEAMMFYQLLESLHCVLEELSFPAPKGFSKWFIVLAQRCLPRCIFLQYVERNVFTVDVESIDKLLSELNDSEEDKLLRYELLCNLNNRNQAIKIMKNYCEYVDFLLQYYLTHLPLKTITAKDQLRAQANLESTNDSMFIPRTVFMNAVLGAYSDDNNPDTKEIVSFILENRQIFSVRLMTETYSFIPPDV